MNKNCKQIADEHKSAKKLPFAPKMRKTQINYAEVLRLNSSGAFINHTLVSDFVDPMGSRINFPREFDAVGILSDGKVIAVGYFGSNADTAAYSNRMIMTRIAIDGSVETTYENPEVNAIANAYSVTFTRSNKILVGGEFRYFGGSPQSGPRLYRFNGDFTPDTTFGTNGKVSYCNPGNIGVGECTARYASYVNAQSIDSRRDSAGRKNPRSDGKS